MAQADETDISFDLDITSDQIEEESNGKTSLDIPDEMKDVLLDTENQSNQNEQKFKETPINNKSKKKFLLK